MEPREVEAMLRVESMEAKKAKFPEAAMKLDYAADTIAALRKKCEELERDAMRIDWIARQGDEFSSGIIVDAKFDGDYYVYGLGDTYGHAETFRAAVDVAMSGGKHD